MKTRLLSLFVAFLATTALWAYDFKFGDLYYNITSSSEPYTVEVSNAVSSITTANIPATVTYNGITYSVTRNEFSNMEEFQFTIAEVRALADDTEATTSGVVNFVSGKNIYIQDATGGLLVYTSKNPTCKVGQKITVKGTKVIYGGIAELKNAVIESVETGKLYDIIELEDLSSLIVDSLEHKYFAKRVKVSNLTIVEYDSYNNPTVQDYLGNQTICYKMLTAFPIGTTVTVNAIASWFNGFQFVGNAADINPPLTIIVESSDTIMGTVSGSGIYDVGEYVVLTATPKTGYHFSYWADGSNDNPHKVQVTESRYYVAYFKKNTYTISVNYNSVQGTVTAPISGKYLDEITLTATPNVGCEFVQWSDGVKDNPRTIVLTQDIVLTAEFTQSYSGQCGDNLYWNYNESSQTLSITGSGKMYDYTNSTQPWLLFQEQINQITTSNTTTSIGNYAFSGCSSLTSVTIPNSVKSIGESAFENCSKLTSVTIPNSVKSIGDYAFYDCSSLTSVVWNAENCADFSSSSDAPFYEIRSNITSFTFGESVQHIPAYLCSGMSNLTSITIPNSVTSIGYIAFSGCSSLTSVTIPESVITLGDGAFYNCSKLTSITIPESVTTIGKGATFQKCTSLKSVQWNAIHCTIDKEYSNKYPNGTYYPPFHSLDSIENFAFGNNITSIPATLCYGLSGLTSITIPDNVTSIGEEAFSGCNNITSITWNAKNCNAYNFGNQVTDFVFGNKVEIVPGSLCNGMENLTTVTIPNSVKTIGISAFEGCVRLGKITLGTGIENIEANAFAECKRLYDIYCYATYPPFAEESSFANYNVYVYIPCEYQRDYILDVIWGKFKFIECIESEEATTDGNVTVIPGLNDVTITWPTSENADTYSLVINKDGKPFCTLTFDKDGRLLNIAFAPGRNGNRPAQYAEQAVNGYRFTVTGLAEATQYAYNIITKDAANQTIATYSGEFTTNSTTDLENTDIQSPITDTRKEMRNGQLLILRDGKTYNAQGVKL